MCREGAMHEDDERKHDEKKVDMHVDSDWANGHEMKLTETLVKNTSDACDEHGRKLNITQSSQGHRDAELFVEPAPVMEPSSIDFHPAPQTREVAPLADVSNAPDNVVR